MMDFKLCIPIMWIINSIIFGLLSQVQAYGVFQQERQEVRLEDIVKEGYDSFQTPPNKGQATDVCVQIDFLNIRSVDVVKMSYIADIFMYTTWQDLRLVYPANKTFDKISLQPEWRKSIWTPDVFFYNAIEGKVMEAVIPYVFLWLKNDSTVIFGARLSLELSCDMTLGRFPHDTQTCDLIIKSLTHTISDMNLHWNPVDSLTLGDYIILPQFDFSTPAPALCPKHHLTGKHGEFACLRGEINLKRRYGYYVMNIYIPSILIVFMSMLTFWMPVDAVPGRVTLGVTSLLTMITKQYQAALPSVSYVVALNVFLSVCIAFVFCSLLEYALVIALRSHQSRVIPEANKGRGTNSDASPVCWDRLCSYFENTDVIQIDRYCRILFPSLYILTLISYISFIMFG
ncbi:glycine receptor subunit alpha-2-like [Argiope bruennichi]|uniref:glycine receptor subunit alpha-2-like n=1 Tax=Argiope bruennichi TaxID=94029 RepID=UPI002494BE07|nr:glycine receptor subunit alpha-2-like [Argiope bruennichi]